MSPITEDAVLRALSQVNDPDLHQDIVTLKMVKDVKIEGNNVAFTVELTTPACPLKEIIERDCRDAVGAIPGVGDIEIEMSSRVIAGRASGQEALVPGVSNIIAVASGK